MPDFKFSKPKNKSENLLYKNKNYKNIINRKSEKKVACRKSKRKRKRNFVIYHVTFFLFAVLIFSVMSVTVLFNLNEIVITGKSRYENAEIISASEINLGENMTRMNAQKYTENITDKLVYIQNAVLSKDFYNRKIIIKIEEALPMANITGNSEDENYIISRKGRILENLKSKLNKNLLIIAGYDPIKSEVGDYLKSDDEKKNELIYEIINEIETSEFKGIKQIDIGDRLEIKLNYMDRVQVYLGSSAQLEQKIISAKNVLENYETDEPGILRVNNPLEPTFMPEDLIADR